MVNKVIGIPRFLTPSLSLAVPCSQKRSPRILFVGESVSLAHIGRPALLARWARQVGCDVHFACGPRYVSIARDEGFVVHSLKTIPAKRFYERLNQGRFFYSLEELEMYVADERQLIRHVRPDLVVSDFRLTLPISAELEGVECLSLQQAHWSPGHACPMSAPRVAPFTFLPSRMAEGIFGLIRPLALKLFPRVLNTLRTRHGLKRLKDLRSHYTAGNACAYLDLPELNPVGNLPENHFYLGPLNWSPAGRAYDFPQAANELGMRRSLAYVSMGSSGDECLLPMVLKTLLAEGFDVVASGVSRSRQEELRALNINWQGRILMRELVNPAKILKRASLTICHGGHGTVYQSLRAGVPVVSLPANPDQGLMAAAVESQGAGRFIYAHRVTSIMFQRILREMFIDTSCWDVSKRLAHEIGTHQTRGRWHKFLTDCKSVKTDLSQINHQVLPAGLSVS